jgi:hypothetical protein
MVVLYSSLLLLLGGAGFLIRRRARSLEKKYSAVLKEANTLLHAPHREGNANRTDAYATAKRTYQLGQLAQKKEKLEVRHYAWQARADRVGRWIERLRSWRGRKLPYTLGLVDAVAILTLLEHLGYGQYTNPRVLLQMVTTWISG